MPRTRVRSSLLLLVGMLALPGCGEPDARPPAAKAPLPHVEPLPMAQRVAYALERLERGPRPPGRLRIPDIHRRNLALAEDDLLGLEGEAQRQLADPERIRRITSMARRNADPWHNVLRVLLGMGERPTELVLAWTEPVAYEDLRLPTLRMDAARVLAALRDERSGPPLLALLEQAPDSRDLGAVCFGALMHAAAPVRRKALQLALERGAPALWADVWTRVASLVPQGERDASLADALAWWNALAGGSGPGLPTELPRLKAHPWMQARLATDPSVPGDGHFVAVYGPVPAAVAYGNGWFASDLTREAVLPQMALSYTGKLPAAECRCVLANWDYAPYRAAVAADAQHPEVDEGLYLAARHCGMGAEDHAAESTAEAIALELDRPGPWTPERVRGLQRLVAGLMTCDAPDVWSVLVRVLFEVQPLDVGRPAVEQAYERMSSRPQDLVPLISAALAAEDPARAGVARHLVRRARDPAYIEALEMRLDAGVPAEEAGGLQRTLIFIYTRGYGVEPARYAPFVQRYRSWLAAASPQEFAGLATGLLDLGEPGEAAFAAGLRGPERDRYLAAWPRDGRVVALDLAAAALEPLDAETPEGVLAGILALGWSSFPAESAAHLEALRRRLAPSARDLVEPVLERVMHRAPFRRRVR